VDEKMLERLAEYQRRLMETMETMNQRLETIVCVLQKHTRVLQFLNNSVERLATTPHERAKEVRQN
jgi:hypothetical protein